MAMRFEQGSVQVMTRGHYRIRLPEGRGPFPLVLGFHGYAQNADEHLAFGTGVHYCLGAHLARMELRAFLAELLSRLESIEPGLLQILEKDPIASNPDRTAAHLRVASPLRCRARFAPSACEGG